MNYISLWNNMMILTFKAKNKNFSLFSLSLLFFCECVLVSAIFWVFFFISIFFARAFFEFHHHFKQIDFSLFLWTFLYYALTICLLFVCLLSILFFELLVCLSVEYAKISHWNHCSFLMNPSLPPLLFLYFSLSLYMVFLCFYIDFKFLFDLKIGESLFLS